MKNGQFDYFPRLRRFKRYSSINRDENKPKLNNNPPELKL